MSIKWKENNGNYMAYATTGEYCGMVTQHLEGSPPDMVGKWTLSLHTTDGGLVSGQQLHDTPETAREKFEQLHAMQLTYDEYMTWLYGVS